ncbi:hypothetical protein LNTAR_22864 [Lentisphaera araneosa HTCC2155]|uniref:Transposase IS200-like domain-containing protein n=1 Tax=Lentisphaera araneosa HTCC2155 TaxID=313628 RepID=A6DGG4_9BACT|nr:transposase [Lentisphaera araneosa]EDM29281.1 hypothetical protein LNTAR_22864 [Lentisphaera araneosa HTCC2155]
MDENDSAWSNRGYLPHYDERGMCQSLTFRLIDSIPQKVIRQFKDELKNVDPEFINREMRKKMEDILSRGMGCCAFKYDELAEYMQNALIHFDSQRYELLAWCIMPNHVHVLIRTEDKLSKIVQSWKSYVGKYALQHKTKFGIAQEQKEFWLREYWDRYIRDEKHLIKTIDYIHQNPVKGGLCQHAEEWRWSSAYK